jgi:hypothetical protein
MRFKFLLLSALLILSSISLQAQRDSLRNLLIGSWKVSGDDPSKSNVIGLPNSVYSFFSDGSYQNELCTEGLNKNGRLELMAKWTLNSKNNTIRLKKLTRLYPTHTLHPRPRDWRNPYGYHISFLSKDSIVLKTDPHNYIGGTHCVVLRRVPIREIRSWLDPVTGDLMLTNVSDSLKKKLIHHDASITLELKNDTLLNYSHSINGTLNSSNADSISLVFESETLEYTDKNDIERRQETTSHANSRVIRSYAIKSIKYIGFEEGQHEVVGIVGGMICFASIVSAVFISPLVAANFSNGSFDSHKFVVASSISLGAGMVIGAPLILIGNGHDNIYFLDTSGEKGERYPLWKIKTVTP